MNALEDKSGDSDRTTLQDCCIFVVCFFFAVMGIKPRVSHSSGECQRWASELHPWPFYILLNLRQDSH